MGRTLGLAAVLALLTACSSIDKKDSNDPGEIYSAVKQLIEEEDFFEAREHIDVIKKRFPQSRFSAVADLRLADVEFEEGSYTEAAAIYGVFVELYPRHAEADYALYRKSLAFLNEAPSRIARDQRPCSDAVRSARSLLKRYPSSRYRKEVIDILFKARLKLAQKEAYIAKFYERKDAPEAAKMRWLRILSLYADLEDTENEDAVELIGEAKKRAEALGKES